MHICDICGHEVKKGILYEGKLTCRECLIRKSKEGNVCPVCGETIAAEHQVAFPLATAMPSGNVKTGIAVVCPRCHVIFFDNFQYELLKSMV